MNSKLIQSQGRPNSDKKAVAVRTNNTLNTGHSHILACYDVGDRLERHRHTFFITNILKSPTFLSPSLSHQHNDVTNITLTVRNSSFRANTKTSDKMLVSIKTVAKYQKQSFSQSKITNINVKWGM